MPNIKRIESLCGEVVAANPKSIEDFKVNPSATLKSLRDEVMKWYKGTVNPQFIDTLLVKLLTKDDSQRN